MAERTPRQPARAHRDDVDRHRAAGGRVPRAPVRRRRRASRTRRARRRTRGEPHKLEIVNVSPAETPPGTAVIIRYRGADDDGRAARRSRARPSSRCWRAGPGRWSRACPPTSASGAPSCASPTATSAASPTTCASRRRTGASRSAGWSAASRCSRFGIGVLARGVREAVGLGSARRLASLARNAPAALGFGTVVGAIVQSTTAAAGVLAGLVTSSLLAVAPGGGRVSGRAARRRHRAAADHRAPRSARGAAGDRGRRAVAGPRVGSARDGARALRARRRADRVRPARAAPGVRAVRRRQHADSVHRAPADRQRSAGWSRARCSARRWWRRSRGRRPSSCWCWARADHRPPRPAHRAGDPGGVGRSAPPSGALLTTPAGARSRRLVQLHLLLGPRAPCWRWRPCGCGARSPIASSPDRRTRSSGGSACCCPTWAAPRRRVRAVAARVRVGAVAVHSLAGAGAGAAASGDGAAGARVRRRSRPAACASRSSARPARSARRWGRCRRWRCTASARRAGWRSTRWPTPARRWKRCCRSSRDRRATDARSRAAPSRPFSSSARWRACCARPNA